MGDNLNKYGLVTYKTHNGLVTYHAKDDYETYITFDGETYTSCDGIRFLTFEEAYKHTYG